MADWQHWLLGINAVAGLGAALVWFVYLALSIRASRWGWVLLSALNALATAYFGIIFFMALLDLEVEGQLAGYLRPAVPFALGLPAMAAYGFLVEGNKVTERALKTIRGGVQDDS